MNEKKKSVSSIRASNINKAAAEANLRHNTLTLEQRLAVSRQYIISPNGLVLGRRQG